MPWASMNPALFWAFAIPLLFLGMGIVAAILERNDK